MVAPALLEDGLTFHYVEGLPSVCAGRKYRRNHRPGWHSVPGKTASAHVELRLINQ